ncbi:uncharacterized protein BX664DRAFT_383149 [Halteromyces radiatus]|uniref:uncharacterized protein n=1 Tax=Halteromyces radiatus TaxID=101107 RepID=UPI00221F31E7|nr:uncharacterized protein BX664DRAFT_383149 [Halteromyces radiatus]KAI8096751.1 hypothetical protein BX664DRAFT_383149 [Halteromyces radiatus]
MAPILLKLHGVSNILDNLNLDELQDTWRVCTNAKQALEEGSRLENISWRRWYLKKQLDQPSTSRSLPSQQTVQQYKRSLLLQQKRQCQQNLSTTANVVPSVFIDTQYHPPPSNCVTMTSTTSSTSPILTSNPSVITTAANGNSTHAAMYVASDETTPLSTSLESSLQSRFASSSSSSSYQYINHPTSINTTNNQTALVSSTLAYYITASSINPTPPNSNKEKPKKYRVRRPLPVINADGNGNSTCNDCGTRVTPLWRRYQNRNLCNACGLYRKLHNSPRPDHLIPSVTKSPLKNNNDGNDDNGRSDDKQFIPQCSNCKTLTTPLWRRNEQDGSPLCNACGLYAKLHQETRPISMKTNVIKKRQRLS